MGGLLPQGSRRRSPFKLVVRGKDTAGLQADSAARSRAPNTGEQLSDPREQVSKERGRPSRRTAPWALPLQASPSERGRCGLARSRIIQGSCP